MACFIVPATEAIITTVTGKKMKAHEGTPESAVQHETTEKIPFSRKLKWLSNMLWGGSALLAFEHVWHGEIVPWAPFLTAAGSHAGTMAMLQEMATTGVTMAALVTGVWLGIVAVTSAIEKKALKPQADEN